MSTNAFMLPEPQMKPVLYRDLNINKWYYGIEVYESLYNKYIMLQNILKFTLFSYLLYPCGYLLFYDFVIFDINIVFSFISFHTVINCLLYIYMYEYVINYGLTDLFNMNKLRLFTYPINTIVPIYISNELSNCKYKTYRMNTYNTQMLDFCLVIHNDYIRDISYIISKEKNTNKYMKIIVENDFTKPYLGYLE
jgi:hypothetical protein